MKKKERPLSVFHPEHKVYKFLHERPVLAFFYIFILAVMTALVIVSLIVLGVFILK